MKSEIKAILRSSIDVKRSILRDAELINRIHLAQKAITASLNLGKRIWFCGNGGSAADAQHLAAEFTGRFYNGDRPAMKAEALHCNSSYITAVANDYGYWDIYSRLVEGVCQQGDVLVGLSTSGNSQNIVNAFQVAQSMGVYTIGFTGQRKGNMDKHSNISIKVPSVDTPRIQEAHITIGHIICELVERNIYPQ